MAQHRKGKTHRTKDKHQSKAQGIVNWIALKIARICLRVAFFFCVSPFFYFFFFLFCLCRNTIKQFINSFVCHFAIFVPGLVLLADFLVPNSAFRTSSSDCLPAHGEIEWICVIGADVPYILYNRNSIEIHQMECLLELPINSDTFEFCNGFQHWRSTVMATRRWARRGKKYD